MKRQILKFIASVTFCLSAASGLFALNDIESATAASAAPEWATGNETVTATLGYDFNNSEYKENNWYYGAVTEAIDLTTKNAALQAEGFWTENDYANMVRTPLFYQTVVGATEPTINLGYYSGDFMMASHAVHSIVADTTMGGNNRFANFDYQGLIYTFTDVETGNYFNLKVYSYAAANDSTLQRGYIQISYNGGEYSADKLTTYYFGGQYRQSANNASSETFSFLNIKYDKSANAIKHNWGLANSIALSELGIPTFGNYKVDMEFWKVKAGKSAGLMVYFLNGYDLNDIDSVTQLDGTDKVVYAKTNLIETNENAEVDVNDLLGVWNSAVGFVDENLTVSVKDSTGKNVPVSNGKFVATIGTYSITATLGGNSSVFYVDVKLPYVLKAEWATGNDTVRATFDYDITNSEYGYVDNDNPGWAIRVYDNNMLLADKAALSENEFWVKSDYRDLKPLFYESVVGVSEPSIQLGYYNGAFKMASTPVQSIECNSQKALDYTGLIYTFTNTESGEYFNIKIWNNAQADTAAKIAISVNGGEYTTLDTFTANFGGRYYGTPNQPKTGTFYTMNVLYDNEENVLKYNNKLQGLQSLADYGLDSFTSYKVDMSFMGVAEDKTAKLCVYYLNGYDLTADLQMQTEKPQIVLDGALPKHAFVGDAVLLPNVYGYDAIDGILNETAVNTSIIAPDGNNVSVQENKIVFDQAGIYTFNYSVQSIINQVEGVLSVSFEVFSVIPVAEQTLLGEIPEEFGVGGTLYLPAAEFVFDAERVNDGYIVVTKGDKIVAFFNDISVENKILLNEIGTYTISYIYTSKYGYNNSFNYKVESLERLAIVAPGLPNGISFNKDGYVLEKGKAKLGDKEVDATITIIAPSGLTVELIDGVLFIPKEIGMHTFVYAAEYKGQTVEQRYEVDVQYSAADLFELSDAIDEVLADVDVNYVKDENLNGVAVITSASGATFTFKNVVDLSKLGLENIIQFQPLTAGDGYTNISQVVVTLTDIYDPSNTVKIKWERNSDALQYSYLSVNPAGAGYFGLLKSDTNLTVYKNQYGTNTESSFYTDRYTGKYAFAVCMDYADKEFKFKSASGRYWTVVDADELSHVGDGNQWKGFTTGEVYITVELPSVNGRSGIIVTSIAGQSLAGKKVVDLTAPSIIVDTDREYLENTMAEGIVGVAYPIPKASANDIVSGIVDTQLSIEYFDGSSWVDVAYEGNSFIPTQVGNYRFVWTAKDVIGNAAEKVLEFTVQDVLADVEVSLGEPLETIYVAGKYYISKVIANGGSGLLDVRVEWFMNDSKVDFVAPGYYQPTIAGTLTAKAYVTDYLGRKTEHTLVIKVENPENPVLTISGVPTSVIKGAEITLPDFTAIDYNFAERENGYYATKQIFVNGQELDINTRKYAVVENKGDLITVRYVANGSRGVSEKIYYVNVLEPTYIDEYFIYDNAKIDVTRDANYTKFASVEDFVVSLPHPVSAYDMGICFYYDAALLANGGGVSVLLTDADDASIQLKFTLVYNAKGVPCIYLNNDTDRMIVVKATSDNSVYFAFSGRAKQISNSQGAKIMGVEYALNGLLFDTFTSGAANVQFNIFGVGAEGAYVGINQVGNQRFVTSFANGEPIAYVDRTAGQLSYEFDFDASAKQLGDVICIPAAKAFDVLQGNATVTVTVQSPTRTIYNNVPISETLYVTADEYGYYRIIYTVKSGIRTDKLPATLIKVKDTVPPEISISGKVSETCKVGDTLTLPSASVSDNMSFEMMLYVFVIEPNGRYVDVTEGLTYTVSSAGKYRVVYYSVDEDYNMASVEFLVVAK